MVVKLSNSSLETIKTREKFTLLNSDDHYSYLLKNKKDVTKYRPDITHQCLLTLLGNYYSLFIIVY